MTWAPGSRCEKVGAAQPRSQKERQPLGFMRVTNILVLLLRRMKPLQHYLDKARDELAEKSLHDIQIETALTWCGRACMAAQMGLAADAKEYAHEAIEHAALSGIDDLLNAVRQALAFHGVRL